MHASSFRENGKHAQSFRGKVLEKRMYACRRKECTDVSSFRGRKF